MILRAILTLTLGAALSGCFFSLDGSLVDRKPEARPGDARREAAAPGTDAKSEGLPIEARTVDLPVTDLASKAEKPGGG